MRRRLLTREAVEGMMADNNVPSGINVTQLLLRCDAAEAERDRLRKALFAVRGLIEPSNPCHFELREVLLDALGPDAAAKQEQGTDHA